MKKATVAPSIMELFKEERTKMAEACIDALLKLYYTKKDSFERKEVIDICEKYLVGYWDIQVSKKSYGTKDKADAGKSAAKTPTTGK